MCSKENVSAGFLSCGVSLLVSDAEVWLDLTVDSGLG